MKRVVKAVLMVAMVIAALAAGAEVEYIDFCEYYPLALGNMWEREAIVAGNEFTVETEVTEHIVVNGFDVWQVPVRIVDYGPTLLTFPKYVVFVGDRLYSLDTAYGEELKDLPCISAHMRPVYFREYPIGVPVGSVTVYHGTLGEMLSAYGCHGVDQFPPGDQPDAIGLDYQDGRTEVFARGLGMVDSCSTAMSELEYGITYPVTPIANEGCPDALFLTSTNTGEEWGAGSAQTITWEADADVVGPDVRLGLHKEAGFLDWIVRRTANDGGYVWRIPTDLPEGADYRLRVQSFSDGSIRDYSDGAFSIVAPPLALTAPNGGESLPAGSIQAVTWVSNDPAVGEDVRLGLHKGSAFVRWLARRTTNDGAYNWVVPTDVPAASNYKLRLQSFTDKTIRDYSDRRFSITAE